MKNQWSEREARSFIARYARGGINKDLALRVYSSRLLGNEPRLVLHGGGNTSVKTTMKDVLGDSVEVLCVKGSGWDMGDIEPEGLPAVRLENLRKLASLDELQDADMVNVQRANLLDSTAPNPSVETLLHAFLPHKFIDHTHANAVLALTDQPDGEALCTKVFGKTMGLVPYIMPGFALAKKSPGGVSRGTGCRRTGAAQARHLYLWRHRQRCLRPNDRQGDTRGKTRSTRTQAGVRHT